MDARVREVGVATAVVATVAAVVLALGYGWTKIDPMGNGAPRVMGQAPASTSGVTTSAADTSAPVEAETAETTGVILGRVTDSAGNPLAHVKVWTTPGGGLEFVQNWEGPLDSLGHLFKPSLVGGPAITDEAGRYRIEVPMDYDERRFLAFEPPGTTYPWTFDGGAAHLWDAEAVTVPAGGQVRHDLALPLAGSITGRVTGPGFNLRRGQSPWTLEAVRLDGEEPRLIRQVPLTSRRWTLDGLPPGTYLVLVTSDATGDIYHPSAAHTRGAKRVKVAPGAEFAGVDIALRSPGQVDGRILDRRGRAMEGVEVVLVGGWAHGKGGSLAKVAGTATTDGSGRWSASLPTGDYTVHLHETPPFNRSVEAGRVQVTAGREVSHRAIADRRATIAGRVAVPARWVSAAFGVEKRGKGRDWTFVGWLDHDPEDGSFSMSGLRAGTYRLTAHNAADPPLRLVGTGAHSPSRFVLRDGLVLTDFNLRAERQKK